MQIYECKNNNILYRVQKYDDLATIMQKFCVGANAVIRNDYSVDFYEGELVKINSNKSTIHIVKPMQTIEIISSMYNLPVEEIIKTNKLKSPRLFIGQKLIISKQ